MAHNHHYNQLIAIGEDDIHSTPAEDSDLNSPQLTEQSITEDGSSSGSTPPSTAESISPSSPHDVLRLLDDHLASIAPEVVNSQYYSLNGEDATTMTSNTTGHSDPNSPELTERSMSNYGSPAGSTPSSTIESISPSGPHDVLRLLDDHLASIAPIHVQPSDVQMHDASAGNAATVGLGEKPSNSNFSEDGQPESQQMSGRKVTDGDPDGTVDSNARNARHSSPTSKQSEYLASSASAATSPSSISSHTPNPGSKQNHDVLALLDNHLASLAPELLDARMEPPAQDASVIGEAKDSVSDSNLSEDGESQPRDSAETTENDNSNTQNTSNVSKPDVSKSKRPPNRCPWYPDCQHVSAHKATLTLKSGIIQHIQTRHDVVGFFCKKCPRSVTTRYTGLQDCKQHLAVQHRKGPKLRSRGRRGARNILKHFDCYWGSGKSVLEAETSLANKTILGVFRDWYGPSDPLPVPV